MSSRLIKLLFHPGHAVWVWPRRACGPIRGCCRGSQIQLGSRKRRQIHLEDGCRCMCPWYSCLKGQFWYFEHWAPCLVCPGGNRVVDTENVLKQPGNGAVYMHYIGCSLFAPRFSVSTVGLEWKDYNQPPFLFLVNEKSTEQKSMDLQYTK